MLNRWVEPELLSELETQGMGMIAFTTLAQGVLTDRYLKGVPEDSRVAQGKLPQDHLDESILKHVRALNEIAEKRGQKLAQMALAWILRDERVTSALIGASSVAQLEMNVAALDNLDVHRRGARGDRRGRGRGRHQPVGRGHAGVILKTGWSESSGSFLKYCSTSLPAFLR